MLIIVISSTFGTILHARGCFPFCLRSFYFSFPECPLVSLLFSANDLSPSCSLRFFFIYILSLNPPLLTHRTLEILAGDSSSDVKLLYNDSSLTPTTALDLGYLLASLCVVGSGVMWEHISTFLSFYHEAFESLS